MRSPTLPSLNPWQAGALRRYASDFERAHRPNAKRIEATQALEAAKRALRPDQFAVVEFIAGRGISVAQLAAKTGRQVADLADLLTRAASQLARHYESEGAEPQ